MIFRLILTTIIISFSGSPAAILLSIILLSILIRRIFIWYKLFFLFFLWGLVYIGGIIIVFTYVVFFSNYPIKDNIKNNFFPSLHISLPLLAFLFRIKFSFPETPTLSREGGREVFFHFSLIGEMGVPFIVVLFLLITLVLMIILSILQIILNQHVQRIS